MIFSIVPFVLFRAIVSAISTSPYLLLLCLWSFPYGLPTSGSSPGFLVSAMFDEDHSASLLAAVSDHLDYNMVLYGRKQTNRKNITKFM